MNRNIIVTIGNERLFIANGNAGYLISALHDAVRVKNDYLTEGDLTVTPEQNITVELTTRDLPPGDVRENADKELAKQAQESSANYSRLWIASDRKAREEKARADELQAKLDKLNATLNPEPAAEVEE